MRWVVVASAAVALALAACAPQLAARSAAPPGRTARLDELHGFWGIKGYRLELSTGVALAVTCRHGGPCERLQVTSDDGRIAEVRQASLDTLERSGIANAATSAGFVVIGRAAGATRVRVHTRRGDRTIAVTVVPPPAHGAPATRAAPLQARSRSARRRP